MFVNEVVIGIWLLVTIGLICFAVIQTTRLNDAQFNVRNDRNRIEHWVSEYRDSQKQFEESNKKMLCLLSDLRMVIADYEDTEDGD